MDAKYSSQPRRWESSVHFAQISFTRPRKGFGAGGAPSSRGRLRLDAAGLLVGDASLTSDGRLHASITRRAGFEFAAEVQVAMFTQRSSP